MVDLANVDGISDLAKPISRAIQTAPNAKQINFCLERHLQQIQVDYFINDNKFRAIHVNNPLSIQTTNDAYLTIDTNCYTN